MLVLDTHIWVWWIEEDSRLPHWLAMRIADPATPVAVSAISVYELSLGFERGRIALNRPLVDWIAQATVDADIQVLPVTASSARLAGQLPRHHLDPLARQSGWPPHPRIQESVMIRKPGWVRVADMAGRSVMTSEAPGCSSSYTRRENCAGGWTRSPISSRIAN